MMGGKKNHTIYLKLSKGCTFWLSLEDCDTYVFKVNIYCHLVLQHNNVSLSLSTFQVSYIFLMTNFHIFPKSRFPFSGIFNPFLHNKYKSSWWTHWKFSIHRWGFKYETYKNQKQRDGRNNRHSQSRKVLKIIFHTAPENLRPLKLISINW